MPSLRSNNKRIFRTGKHCTIYDRDLLDKMNNKQPLMQIFLRQGFVITVWIPE